MRDLHHFYREFNDKGDAIDFAIVLKCEAMEGITRVSNIELVNDAGYGWLVTWRDEDHIMLNENLWV